MEGLIKGTLCLIFAVILVAQAEGLTVRPNYDTYYVKAQEVLELNCTAVGEDIEWYLNGNLITQNLKRTSVMENSQTKTDLQFSKSPALVADTGVYKCQSTSSTANFELNVKVISVNTTDLEFKRNMEPAGLSCDIQVNPTDLTSVTWEKDHKPITEIPKHESKYNIITANNTLVINEIERTDAGEYQCVLEFKSTSNGSPKPQFIKATSNLFASPLVWKFEKSKNLIKGDHLELKCGVYGHPLGNITWKKDDVVLEEMGRLKFEPSGGIPNGKLKLSEVDFDDKGTYMCLVTSTRFSETSNSTIVVRVKDKLAALWPFLGIVAEVVILCIIIFIYEKKRSKEDPDSADEVDIKGEGANANESNEVRQRNVRT